MASMRAAAENSSMGVLRVGPTRDTVSRSSSGEAAALSPSVPRSHTAICYCGDRVTGRLLCSSCSEQMSLSFQRSLLTASRLPIAG